MLPSLDAIRERLLPQGQLPHSREAPIPMYSLPRQERAAIDSSTESVRELHCTRPGKAGQVVCVESLFHDDLGSGQAVLPSPTFVLLDKFKFESGEKDIPEFYRLKSMVWQGWMVCPDSDYMNEWDVLLDDHAFREDSCKFVQTWNRVEVYLPSVHRVAGLVDEPLLRNIRYLARRFSTGQDDDAVPAAGSPGQLVQRQLPFGVVSTGSVQDESDQSDPRNSYVQICGHYAALFSDAVWSMLNDAETVLSAEKASAVVPKPTTDMLALLKSLFSRLLVPASANAMAAGELDRFRFRILVEKDCDQLMTGTELGEVEWLSDRAHFSLMLPVAMFRSEDPELVTIRVEIPSVGLSSRTVEVDLADSFDGYVSIEAVIARQHSQEIKTNDPAVPAIVLAIGAIRVSCRLEPF